VGTTVTDEIRRLVLDFFGGDEKKTALWFGSANPLLGGASPEQMITMGRANRLLRFVRDQFAQNEQPDTE
jgi:hypothetical protein